jgi:hypothetical protein
MGAAAVVALVACCVALAAASATIAAAVSIRRRARELSDLAARLTTETLPMVRDARTMIDQAATEMERVGDVLGSAEAVSATVDSASRLAYMAFANPVVKTVAFGSGLGGATRRLFALRSSGRRTNGARPKDRARRPVRKQGRG